MVVLHRRGVNRIQPDLGVGPRVGGIAAHGVGRLAEHGGRREEVGRVAPQDAHARTGLATSLDEVRGSPAPASVSAITAAIRLAAVVDPFVLEQERHLAGAAGREPRGIAVVEHGEHAGEEVARAASRAAMRPFEIGLCTSAAWTIPSRTRSPV
jgi:hypothetical protein